MLLRRDTHATIAKLLMPTIWEKNMTRVVKRVARITWVLAACAAISGTLQEARAQTNPNLDAGLHPFASYDSSQFDHVNLQNGQLSLRIPLFSYPQRGDFNVTVVLMLGSQRWTNREYGCSNFDGGDCLGKWRLGTQNMEG